MSSNFRRFPYVVEGLLALGGPRLTELAASAGVSRKGLPKAPGAIAGALRDNLPSPAALKTHLTSNDLDKIGERLQVGKRSTWKGSSFDEAVVARLFEEQQSAVAPEPKVRKSSRDPSGAAAWPELRSIEMWVCQDDRKQGAVAKALAKALGPQVKAIEPLGLHRFPRFEDAASGLVFVAVAGDTFEMGLSDTEKRALTKLTKTWSEEAQMHVRDLQTVARPAHEVYVPAFLCVEKPITAAHAAQRMPSMEVAGEVCLFDPSAAVSYAKLTHTRLLTEAEWEFVARLGGSRSWLSVRADPRKNDPEGFVRETLAKGLAGDDGFVFGIRGLAWGSWVEDGWHPSYQGAPTDGSAWEPRELPEVVRGGAFLSWPWQIDGEALLLHAAHREREQKRKFPLLLARDLPTIR